MNEHEKSILINSNERHYLVNKDSLPLYVSILLKSLKKCESTIVIIGTIPEMKCLKKMKLAEISFGSCSVEVQHCLFDGDQIVLVFSNFARALSLQALTWYQNRKISAVIKIIGNEFENQINQLAEGECSANLQCFNGLTYNISYTSRDLIDITEFCCSLKEQRNDVCEQRLSDPMIIKSEISNELKYSWEDVKNSLQEVKHFTIFGVGIKKFNYYTLSFSVLLEEYRQCIKSGCKAKTVKFRAEAANFILVLLKSLTETIFNISKKDKFNRLLYFMGIQYAKYSVWFNPNFSEGYLQIIRICQDVLKTLKHEKDWLITEANKTSKCTFLNDLIKNNRSETTSLHVQTIPRMDTSYYNHFEFLQLLQRAAGLREKGYIEFLFLY